MSQSEIADETFSLPRGGALILVLAYAAGILLGIAFLVLWLTGLAAIGLGAAGIGIAGLCLYLLPESLGPAFVGDSLVLGRDGVRFLRGQDKTLGNIPYANIDNVSINEADGGRSLWVRLKDPEASGTSWPGGLDSMNVIFSQCEHHLVIGQGLPIAPPELQAKLIARIEG